MMKPTAISAPPREYALLDTASSDQPRIESNERPAGGWGSLKSITGVLRKEHAFLEAAHVLPHQNKPDGYACVSCAWAKPEKPHSAEFCENGAKATAWEITSKRTTPLFFL